MQPALVVEDEIALRLIYERVLLPLDYDIEYVSDGMSALHYLQSVNFAPALIVMDMLLPDDGAQQLFDYLVLNIANYEATHFILTSSAPHFASYTRQLPRSYFARKPLLPRQFNSLMQKIQDSQSYV